MAPERLGEFLAAYLTPDYGPEEKPLLMELILSAADDELSAGEPLHPQTWNALRGLCMANSALHRPTLDYWCLWQHEGEEEDWFAITKPLRGLYADLYS